MAMPRRQDIDPELRIRIAGWTKHLMTLHGIPSIRQMAKRMKKAGPTVTNALNLQSGIGLDYVVALHRTFHVSADGLLDTDPPKPPPTSVAPAGPHPLHVVGSCYECKRDLRGRYGIPREVSPAMEKTLEQRYRANLAAAKTEARDALTELERCLKRSRSLRALASAARRVQLASAALYTAATCIISPP